MIALPAPPPAASAPAPARFAPPLGRPLLYRATERQPGATGDTIVTLIETMRFDRAEGGRLLATQTLRDYTIEASPRAKAVLDALEGAFRGRSLAMTLEPDGTPGALVDPEGSWAEVAASFAAMERRAGEGNLASAEQRASLAAMIRAQMPRTVEALDARLRAAIARLLPPRAPPLVAGEPRQFETTIASAAGPVAARGVAMLLERSDTQTRYRTEIAADSAAAARAAADLRAPLNESTPAPERARIEAAAMALETTAFSQEVEVATDTRTGLLRSLVNRRFASDAGGGKRLIAELRIELEEPGI